MYDLITRKQYTMKNLSHLDYLEAESISIFRELVNGSKKPVMLYSMGKDSCVLLHLAKKAFYPSLLPFPLLHIDTKWKFKEMYKFRDEIAKDHELLVYINDEGIKRGINPVDHGSAIHTDIMKTQALKKALDYYEFDVAIGGARRDEEKSRAKERIFSFRDSSHLWEPRFQRPEVWSLYNLLKNENEKLRVFPLSNWTELDVWEYIYKEKINIVPLYFSKNRKTIYRDGSILMLDDKRLKPKQNEKIEMKKIRFRSLGCYPLTGAITSEATNLIDIIFELLNSKKSERESRIIDLDNEYSMELKKKDGYF